MIRSQRVQRFETLFLRSKYIGQITWRGISCVIAALPLWSYERKKINERKREWRKRQRERESKENGDMRVFSRVFSTFCLECKICAINKFSLFSFSFGYFLYVHELYVWGLLLMWEWVCGFEQALKWSQRVIIAYLLIGYFVLILLSFTLSLSPIFVFLIPFEFLSVLPFFFLHEAKVI